MTPMHKYVKGSSTATWDTHEKALQRAQNFGLPPEAAVQIEMCDGSINFALFRNGALITIHDTPHKK
jgi:hypothetical protein